MNKTNFIWYYNRLKSMNLFEIIYRIRNYLVVIFEKFTRINKSSQSKLFEKLNIFYFDNTANIMDFYANNEIAHKNLLHKADLILEHKVSFFSLENEFLGEKIDWHKDYLNKKNSPIKFYSDIDFRNFPNVDVKYIWELNRFQHLFPLSQALIFTSEEKYATEIISQINNWIDENPYLFGINWTSSVEISLRLVSWIWQLFALEKTGYKYDNKIKEKISTSIYQQTEYIYRHLSLYSSSNNHLITEAMGLTLIGTLFDYGKISEKWKKKGFSVLFRELNKQIYEDGLNKEQTFNYHCYTLNIFLTTFLLLKRNNIFIPSEVWAKLEKMAECIFYFVDDNLNSPNFGDSDDSFILKLDNYFENDLPIKKQVRFLLNAAAIIFNRNDFKSLTKDLDETTLWIFNKEEIITYHKMPIIKLNKNALYFEESKYMLFKSEDVNAFIDTSEHGYLSITAHAHADALSFCLNYKNKEFLVDPGTYSYIPGEKRDYYRKTSSHNTLEVDEQNQSKIAGNFLWGIKAKTFNEKVIISDEFDYIRAYHDGYIQQNINVKHLREVLFRKNKFFIIIDRIKNYTPEEHHYMLNWNFHKNCEISQNLNNFIINRENDNIFMKIFCNNDSESEISEEWFSEKFGVESRSFSIKTKTTSSKDIVLVTVIAFTETCISEFADEILKINYKEEVYNYNLVKGYINEE